jgi:hypothetical protein
MIEQVVVAFAKIFFMKEHSSKEEANVEINKLALERIGLDIDKVEELDSFEILNILGKNTLTFEENSEIIAELLNIKGDIYSKESNINNAYNCYLKSLEIYLYLSTEGINNFIFDDKEKINDIEYKLNQYVLPIETEILLFKHKLRNEEYSNAEDNLFDILQMDKSDRIIELGINFYNQLLTKTDDELEKGNFSRTEIHQGIAELNKLNSVNEF